MIMLSIAGGLAVAANAEALFTGVHAGDHFIYPDCRPRFMFATNAALTLGNMGFGTIKEFDEGQMVPQFIQTPYIESTKADIAERALGLGVPLNETWSCYKGGDIHCGRCGTCVERLEAIDEAIARFANVEDFEGYDPTEYEDTTFWRQAVGK
jgi:7-cyano-7-deazaguanine synthase